MKILVTGCAGFIGFSFCLRELKKNKKTIIYGVDNVNNYYDTKLKNRLKILSKYKNFKFYKYDLRNYKSINTLISKNNIKIILHLAAQAGVRYSIHNPKVYFDSNLKGFFNILKIAQENKIKHFIFASTSSFYGFKKKYPISEKETSDNPLSFYAATKKCNEILAFSFSNIYKLPCTGLRFFTVCGPMEDQIWLYLNGQKLCQKMVQSHFITEEITLGILHILMMLQIIFRKFY